MSTETNQDDANAASVTIDTGTFPDGTLHECDCKISGMKQHVSVRYFNWDTNFVFTTEDEFYTSQSISVSFSKMQSMLLPEMAKLLAPGIQKEELEDLGSIMVQMLLFNNARDPEKRKLTLR